MTRIHIAGDSHAYDVVLGSDLIADTGALLSQRFTSRRCAIISDTNIAPLLAGTVQDSLASCGITSTLITLGPGENHKNLAEIAAVIDRLLGAGLDRECFVIGLGGGVIGDISGFVAAIFHRGVPHVQIPTTLLAMVDSSIGGKTGVNTSAGKNLIGAIHHPALVIDDVNCLQTLPEREFRQGFAEIIKHAIISDAEMFEQLRVIDVSHLKPNQSGSEALVALIRRNIEIKGRIISADDQDRKGNRALLNFGHTVGHGIERACNYSTFLHGEAISLGIIGAATVSGERAGLASGERDSIREVLRRFDLPTQLPNDFPRSEIVQALAFDKKFRQGEVRFVVTPGIGSAYLSSDVSLDDIERAVEKL
ncbi:MAG: 3-dehydroquinate synthase [Chthoniobacterales bacterium]